MASKIADKCAGKILNLAKKTFSKEEAEEIVDEFAQLVGGGKKEVDLEQAIDELIGKKVEAKKLERAYQARNAILTVRSKRRVSDFIKAYDGTPGEAMLAYIEGRTGSKAKGASAGLYQKQRDLEEDWSGNLIADLEEAGLYKDYIDGKHDEDVWDEFYGKNTGNAKAQTIVKIYRKLKRDMIQRQNLAGGYIKFREDHVIRQTHDISKIEKKFKTQEFEPAYEGWRNEILPLLDEKTFTDVADQDAFLRGVFKGIRSGWHGKYSAPTDFIDINAGFKKTGSMAKKISSERLLIFKDGQSAFKYSRDFGVGDIRSGILSDIGAASRASVLMEGFGPNYQNTLDDLLSETRLKNREGTKKELRSLDASNTEKIKNALKFVDGSINNPANPTLGSIASGLRAVLAMSKLGAIAVNSLADTVFANSAMTRNGVSSLEAFFKTLGAAVPKTKADKIRLLRMRAGVEGVTNNVISRYHPDTEGVPQSVLRFSNKFFKATGITGMTAQLQRQVVDALSRNLGDSANLKWGELGETDSGLKNILEAYDWGESDWDVIRKGVYHLDETGNKITNVRENSIGVLVDSNGEPVKSYLTPDVIDKLPENSFDSILASRKVKPTKNERLRVRNEVKSKFGAYLTGQMDEGVVMPGAREKRLVSGFLLGGSGSQSGTLNGEFWKTFNMFRAFPTTVMTKILPREAKFSSKVHQLTMATQLFAAGVVVTWINDLLKGREPKSFFMKDGSINTKLLVAALTKSGGAGILGDLLFTEYDRGARSPASVFFGPGFGTAFDALTLASESAREGEFQPERAIRLAKNNTPFINLFYLRPLFDYFVFNNITEYFDPGKLRNIERHIQRENEQEFFARPSEGGLVGKGVDLLIK
jgi:hypothetical protein